MTLCEDCIHMIRRIGTTVDCEAHRYPVKSKKECEAYLSIECEDEKQITKSNYIAEDMMLGELERHMYKSISFKLE